MEIDIFFHKKPTDQQYPLLRTPTTNFISNTIKVAIVYISCSENILNLWRLNHVS